MYNASSRPQPWTTWRMFFFCLCFFFAPASSVAQHQDNVQLPTDWFLLDPEDDRFQGMRVDKAYRELLQNTPSDTVIVAIIDSGVDIEHEDLQGSIWTNEDEVPGNGIDDDGNGYVDDVHGWNFIGGEKGNVNQDAAEITREYKRLKTVFAGMDTTALNKKQRKEYEAYKKIEARFESQFKTNAFRLKRYDELYGTTVQSIDTLKKVLGVNQLTIDNVQALESEDPRLVMIKKYLLSIFENVLGTEGNLADFILDIKKAANHFRQTIQYIYNETFDPRSIVGDHYEDLYEKGYGNNDVKGLGAEHGTHVAGIVGANRHNAMGIRGIVEKVKIMPIRVVPNGGDERDKDVANAILYAVDNGAQIINMSFGKSLSPRKEAVDRAVRYAEKKGVLLVHSAGNDGKSIDLEKTFPCRYYSKKNKTIAPWVEVGASSWSNDEHLVANFSNYGKKELDVFAPGTHIKSTTINNDYEDQQGTSMAAPMVTGVAALLLSYFPQLSAVQVKDIIRRSARHYEKFSVLKPGAEKTKVKLSELSNTGGLVDAYEAVKQARSEGGNL